MSDVIIKRSGKVAYYGIPGEDGVITYHRMRGFTEFSTSKNPKEYNRQYVDEDSERTDVVGYAPSVSYAFDEFKGNEIHGDIINITNNEKIGADAVRSIIVVDFSSGSADAGYSAIKRDFAVIPDSEGDSMDAYTYSGTFKANGDKTVGTCTVSEDNMTAEFAEA